MSQISQVISEAKSHLKKLGGVELSERGVWSLTEIGEAMTPEELAQVGQRYWAVMRDERARRLAEQSEEPTDPEEESEEEPELTWQDEVVERLKLLDPAQFERLAQHLLREAGFTDVRVTSKVGDGGIDGVGVYQVNDLLGFHVYWQSKRWNNPVGAPEVRDFRGAM